jgi:hypothetical protein
MINAARRIILFSSLSITLATIVDLMFFILGGLANAFQQMLWGLLRMYTPLLSVAIISGPHTLKRYFRVDKRVTLTYLLAPLLVYFMLGTYAAFSAILGVFDPSTLEAVLRATPGAESLDIRVWVSLMFVNAYIYGVTLNTLFAVGEEVGWRGFLLDELESISPNLIKNIVIIGVIWGIWHAPAILLLGYNYPESRVLGTALFTLFAISFTPLHVLMRKISSSILPAASLHGSMNAIWGLTLLISSVPREVGGLGIIAVISCTSGSAALWATLRRMRLIPTKS